MSPKQKKKLNLLRKKLDKLDDKFLRLIKVRYKLINEVISCKNYKKEIIDKKRIRKILQKIKTKSLKNRIDPKVTNKIWKNMILAFIDYEYRNFKKK